MADAFLEASSAGIGSFLSTSCVYPLEIVKSKLACGATTDDGKPPTASTIAKDIAKESGPLGFFKGVQYSSSKSAIEKFVYFYAYSFLRKYYEAYIGKMGAFGNIAIGYVADWTHLPITQPLETVLIRVQNKRPILDEKGVAGLYKGVSAQIVLCFKNAIQNTVFDQIKAIVCRIQQKGSLTAVQAFFLGALGRAVATVAVWPYQRAKVVMQTTTRAKDEGPQSVPGTMAKIAREDGVLALYQGLPPELMRGVLSAAIMYLIKEKIFEMAKKMAKARR